MDYKKKYEEAERLYRTANADQRYVLESLFPKLRESEDERTRKELLELVKRWKEKAKGFCPEVPLWPTDEEDCDRYIAWLEKQGENKKEMNNFDVLPGLYKCVHRMFDETPDSKLLFEVGNVYKCLSKHDRAEFEVSYGHSVYLEDPVVCKHFIPFEKQSEQEKSYDTCDSSMIDKKKSPYGEKRDFGYFEEKPVNKVGPKFKVGDRVIGIASGIQYYITEVCDDYYDTESGCIIRFCSQDNFKLYEQKPAWSEEDDKWIESLIQTFEDGYFEGFNQLKSYGVIDWLKSLKEK